MNNAKKEIIMSALLCYSTIREASEKTGIPETTIYNWLRNPEFREEYEHRKAELTEQASRLLLMKTSEAISTVSSLMTEPIMKPQIRLQAAKIILEYSLRMNSKQPLGDNISDAILDESG